MKKIVLSMSIGLLLLGGCSEENLVTQIEEQTGDLVYVFNSNSENPVWEAIILDELESTQSISLDELESTQSISNYALTEHNNGNSVHTHGDLGPIIQEWSGTQNNGGVHGSASLLLFGFSEITMETECVMVEDNEAVYGGTITEISPPFGPPFEIGAVIYFKVIDNGQGNNAPADQINPITIIAPVGSPSGCDVFTPSFFLWDVLPNDDVPEPGSVKVNH